MSLSIAISRDRDALSLRGRLDASVSLHISLDLIRRLNLLSPFDVDLSGIEAIDQSGLEFLLVLKDSGLVARFTQHSRAVLAALHRQRGGLPA